MPPRSFLLRPAQVWSAGEPVDEGWHLFLHPYNETLWDDQVLGIPYQPPARRCSAAPASRKVVQSFCATAPRLA
ncbi:MAG: hypothetical protein E6K43_07030 [Gammaproteobacteria bacterium]|nr:MAG: hypothetical protein E6K43_07030 [Gammaproteobacteria bacterium]